MKTGLWADILLIAATSATVITIIIIPIDKSAD